MTINTYLAAIAIVILTISSTASAQGSNGEMDYDLTIPEIDASRPDALKALKDSSKLREGRSNSLSRRLRRTNGLISPHGGQDPGIEMPAPILNPRSMPIIPPKATGGQNAK